jgi:hypothetical protein
MSEFKDEVSNEEVSMLTIKKKSSFKKCQLFQPRNKNSGKPKTSTHSATFPKPHQQARAQKRPSRQNKSFIMKHNQSRTARYHSTYLTMCKFQVS